MATKKTSADYIREFQAVHGGRYDYSKTEYVNAVTNLQVACPMHGDFWQTPSNHLRGRGCPKCSHEAQWDHTFKQQCKERGIDYWRALKRREAGMSDEKVFEEGYVRGQRKTATALTDLAPGFRIP
ncbi:MAG: hypothetical protein ABJA84_10315 [Polaromonas sp.]